MSAKSSLAILACAALLTGCVDYMDHRDSITFGAGDAQEANIGVQTINPFSKASYNTRIEMEGKKMQQAHDRYMTPCDPDIVVCKSDGGSTTTSGTSKTSGGGVSAQSSAGSDGGGGAM